MKKILLISAFLALTFASSNAQSPVGIWKTIDDETGQPKSYVELYESNGKIFGKINQVLQKDAPTTCSVCPGTNKNKPLVGMVILTNMTPSGSEYTGGKILDPKSGKVYSCTIALESNDKLKVRGFLGFSLLGRTQYWYRVK